VGQIVRNYGYAEPASLRPRLWERQYRVMKLDPSFVERVVKELLDSGVQPEPHRQPLAFCLETACEECPYLNLCDMKQDKEKWVQKYGKAKMEYLKKQREEEFRSLIGPDLVFFVGEPDEEQNTAGKA
jgi:hypothetical protein